MRIRFSKSTCMGFAAGMFLGACLGHFDAPGVPEAQGSPIGSAPSLPMGLEPGSTDTDLESALMDTWSSNLKLAARINSLEALIESMGTEDVSQAVESSIAQMSDRDLASVLASTIHMSREEIEDVGDLRAFAQRVADIAMDDTLVPSDEASRGDRVAFGTGPQPGVERSQFGADESRIYAVFPTDYFDQNKVMVKWYRRDSPEILLLQRYPIVRGDDYGHVWFEPESGWEQGSYKVDVYSGDESMTLLASGSYRVR